MYQYKYPHPAVTVDCVVFGLDEDELKVLLIQRKIEPFKGQWALPGGFIDMDENLEESARRELREETGVQDLFLEQLATYGKPGRDPRERVITVAYFAIVNLYEHKVEADTDAEEAAWFPVENLPKLAFDHQMILDEALIRLQNKIRYKPLVFEFLPSKFTIRQVQHLYETILCKNLDKRNFRKKIFKTGLIIALDEYDLDISKRAAQLYSFNREEYKELAKSGFEFEV